MMSASALTPGEVHALIGENGAGKSTTMKIMSGYLGPTSGEVALNGSPVRFASSHEAEAQGVVLIHQEFNLADQLTVEQNIFLGHEKKRGLFVDSKAMQAEAKALLERLNCSVSPNARVRDIANADKQMVEIAKALSRNASVLIMDEPTAVLTEREAEVLFEQVERLKAAGVAILFTSHKLDEVKRISDRITVLRDGSVVSQGRTADYTEDQMAEAMVGRDVSSLYPVRDAAIGSEVVLSVKGLTVPGYVRDISFDLHKGEILGISGLIGSGRTEAMEGLVGLRSHVGQVQIKGAPVAIKSPAASAGSGSVLFDRGPQKPGVAAEQGDARKPDLAVLAGLHQLVDRPKCRRGRPDQGYRGFRHSRPVARCSCRQPVRWQPAKAVDCQDHAGPT